LHYRSVIPDKYGRIAHSGTPESQLEIVNKVNPEVVVYTHWPTVLAELSVPSVLDLHGPHLLERHYQKYGTLARSIDSKLTAIARSDFYTCAGEFQKWYFIPWLEMAGVFDVASEKLIRSIPISVSPILPSPPDYQSLKQIKFIYAGIFLPWQDPFQSFAILRAAMKKRNRGVLAIYGGPHPIHPIPVTSFDELRRDVSGDGRVELRGLVPHDTLLKEYRNAHVALDLMKWNLERELAFTTRTVEYLSYGLPVIYNNYAELSGYIEKYKAGWCVDPEDPVAIREVVEQILDNPQELKEYSINAQTLVKENFTWDKTINPLVEFCKNPKKREKTDQSAYVMMKAFYQAGARDRTPMEALLSVYSERVDLQRLYPEVVNGEYARLLSWAITYGVAIDSQRAVLIPHKAWYESHLNYWTTSRSIITRTVQCYRDYGLRETLRRTKAYLSSR